MRSKIVAGILVLLCAPPLVAVMAQSQLPELVVEQLPALDGKVPVEIVARLVDTELHMSVRNNTVQDVNAIMVAMRYTRAIESGHERESTTYPWVDTLLHPDFREMLGNKAIAPGEERTFFPRPKRSSLVGVKRITLSLDYVDFADGTELGPNKRGWFFIVNARKGAVKYRQWLATQPVSKFSSAAALEAVLIQADLLAEVRITDEGEKLGANTYRHDLRSGIQQMGIEAIRRYFKK